MARPTTEQRTRTEKLEELADMKNFVMELDLMMKSHGAIIRKDARFMRPFMEMRDSAKVRLKDLEESVQ